jgi:major membrane immunogen (membrane-anchored lipoprotein)
VGDIIATSWAWGAGRARGAFTSSISTSVDGWGGFLGVFLVDGAIVRCKREYEKEVEK